LWRGAGYGPGEDARRSIAWDGGLNSWDWGTKLGGCERHVDVFEEDLAGDPSHAVRGLDEVIAGTAGLFATESVGKDEWFGELTSVHQEAGAVNGPLIFEIHKRFLSHLGRGRGSFLAFGFQVSSEHGHSADGCFKRSRLYAQKGDGSITKELCNGGICVRRLDAMNPHQASITGTSGWRASGGV